MRFPSILFLLALAAPARAEEAVFNFRGGKFSEKVFRYDGPGAKDYFTPEPEGLRLRFTPEASPPKTVGLILREPPRGDFALTLQYEMLKLDQPKRAWGLGLEMYLMLGNETKDGISWGRMARKDEGLCWSYSHMTYIDGARKARDPRVIPATPASARGRMRVVRQGPTLVASFAEGDQQEFTELYRDDLGDAPVTMVRLSGLTGSGEQADFDVRLIEWRVEGPEVAATAGSNPADRPAGTRWLMWGGIVGVLIAAGLLATIARRVAKRPA